MMLLAKLMYNYRFALYGFMLSVLFFGLSMPKLLLLSLVLFPIVYYLDKKFIKVK